MRQGLGTVTGCLKLCQPALPAALVPIVGRVSRVLALLNSFCSSLLIDGAHVRLLHCLLHKLPSQLLLADKERFTAQC